MSQGARALLGVFSAVVCLGLSAAAWAGSVLIVNGASATSEPSTTADITAHLQALETAAGNTTTVADIPPASLAPYDEVWDIRFSNSWPLTAGDQAEYLAFLQSGKRMFVMGENAGFATRNTSVIAFITLLGGGNLTFVVPAQTQTVNPPFTSPNPVTTISYSASGGATSAGTGFFATSAGGSGSAIAWSPGQLSNAAGGRLVVVFDVNFMQASASTNEINFFKNLIGFITNGGGPPATVPTLSQWALIVLSLMLVTFGMLAAYRRRR